MPGPAHCSRDHPPNSSSPGDTGQLISSECYLANKYGARLKLPSCPCVVVELSKQAQQRCGDAGSSSSSSSEQDQYRTYPLEFCWPVPTKPRDGSKLKRRNPRHIWPPTPITPDPNGPTASTAPWIAAALMQQFGADIKTQQEAAPAATPAGSAEQRVQAELRSLIDALLPSQREDGDMHCVVEAVANAIARAPPSGAWTVARAKSVGSFEKRTNLAGTSDLDVIIVLKCNSPSHHPFEACRMQLLDQVQQQLCQPLSTLQHAEGDAADAKERLRAQAAHGWQLLDCVPVYYMTLQHTLLHMQLDVQVAQYHGETQDAQWRGVMQPVQEKAEAAAACGQLPAVVPARQRTTDLTELSVLAVRGVDKLYLEQHGRSGYGRLATDVMRLCKAFAKFGLPGALAFGQAGGEEAAAAAASGGEAGGLTLGCSSSSSLWAVGGAGSAAAPFKGPPAYVWEILVLYVLQRRAADGMFFAQSCPLNLFMAVLQAASELLRTAGDAHEARQRAVILDMSGVHPEGYTKEQALTYEHSWGSGRVHTPYIINPVDPTFNCTIMQPFRAWDAVAEAAGQLHAQLMRAIVDVHGGGGGDRDDGAGDDAMQHVEAGGMGVLSSTTLGPVWDAFRSGHRQS
ncbi:hypothetical protein COO60DRAFT_6714 [Scenedesmus sp. NREL 46B-D3]|nr:hypothetical protein COO60DRAFT_6714 [Scenedesmus sp. NREL 46B-D3]